jgi:hypothetical protein
LAISAACCWLGFGQPATGDEAWQPADGRLNTRWTGQVSPENAHRQYPRPTMVRPDWQSLNGLWQLESAGEGQEPPLGRSLEQRILVPFPIESALSGVMKRADRVWYRRTFEVPGSWHRGRVLLHFGAVDWEARVWVNGHQLASHRGGYDAFHVDITDALHPSGAQELIVGVFDPTDKGNQPRGKQVNKPHGIYYTPTTGIWQSVWLEPVPEARIERLRLVPDVDNACLRLTAEGVGTNSVHTIQAVVRTGETEVAKAYGGVGGELVLNIPADHLRLWSPDDPFLYDVEVLLQQSEETVDRVESYFGLRKIELKRDGQGHPRLALNGEILFQIGLLDQGFWPDGLYTAPTDEALRYDIEMAKRLGFNMLRKHVKVEPARWYYWCDRLGMLVWQDMPNGNNKTPESKRQFAKELAAMVDGLANHPSIVAWVIFNEGWGQHDTEHYVDWVRQRDPTRLIDNASGWTDRDVGDVHDIHKYPGPEAPEPEADRAGVLGEFGGLGLRIDGHTWAPKHWGYRGTTSRRELTQRYTELMRKVWELRESKALSAAVYTQVSDVETECNGVLTYDRQIVKVDADMVAAANRGEVPSIEPLLPTAKAGPATWHYTFDQPPDNWFRPVFDDQGWKQGPSGFGTAETPGAVVRTEWKTPEIWLRRRFDLPEVDKQNLFLSVHHDEDVQIYLNGVLAAEAEGYTVDYELVPIAAKALEMLTAGENVLAVHCRQTGGGQYVDVGLVRLVYKNAEEGGATPLP